MKPIHSFFPFFLFLLYCISSGKLISKSIYHISFGSCLSQKKDMGILKSISTFSPNYFIFMGDTIYKDTYDIEEKIKEYRQLGEYPDFRDIQKKTKLFATWDDHDYGVNDSGEEYPLKKESQRVFLNFFYPKQFDEKSKQEGIYSSEYIVLQKLKIHIILLDTRYFRTSLKKRFDTIGDYIPNPDEDATILGPAQWNWLESELKRESDLTLIVSSIQFYNEEHPFEKWGNFPLERKKMMQLLDKGKFKHLVILSGDRHLSESFRFQTPNSKQIYEITSSPLNKELPIKPKFPYREDRLGDVLFDSSFGNIEIQEDGGIYTFQFQYILKNLEKVQIPIQFSIQKSP